MSWTMPIKQKATVQNKKENNWDCNCDSFRAKQQILHCHFSVNFIVPFTPGIFIIRSHSRRALLPLIARELSPLTLGELYCPYLPGSFPVPSFLVLRSSGSTRVFPRTPRASHQLLRPYLSSKKRRNTEDPS